MVTLILNQIIALNLSVEKNKRTRYQFHRSFSILAYYFWLRKKTLSNLSFPERCNYLTH